ncbi:F-box/kelch-repeat protein At3g06240-like [Prunus dulcis]|uniref:F-box/kelch-repeat protein At3g06240-like n=1 Tax=Prunus dulcis TaxID=3755 RepID=UPI001482F5DD|nr:F-box/kelch-repeat protein At3g06240-like [Prunus dulcis]
MSKRQFRFKGRTVKVVETCNGLVCLHHRLTTLIWNPCTRKFVILPPGTVSASEYDPRSYSFGYDSCTDDNKVLRFVRERRVSCAVEVWSLARGSWRNVVTPNFVDEMLPSTMFGPVIEPAFVNGAMHWIQDRVDENVILSFDLSTESFGKILLPNADSRIKFRMFVDFYYVSRCVDSLAFFENNRIRSTALVS